MTIVLGSRGNWWGIQKKGKKKYWKQTEAFIFNVVVES